MKNKNPKVRRIHRKLLQYIREQAFPMLFKLSYVNGEEEKGSNSFQKIQKILIPINVEHIETKAAL